MRDSYTIFGKGFLGINIKKFLLSKKNKVYFPKKKKYKFKKNLHNIIYCIGSDNWMNDPEGAFQANLGLIPKIIFNNKFKSFTLISSTRIYSSKNINKSNENDSIYINPNNVNFYYNALKLSAESLCLSIPNKKIKVVRISNLFGDHFTKQIYLLPTLIRDSIFKKKINILINKNSTKDFIFADEAINVLLKIIKRSKYRIYNIASGKNIKLANIANKIKKITNCKVVYRNQRKIVKDPKIDIKRIRNEFNFIPNKKLLSSLECLIKNYKKNNYE